MYDDGDDGGGGGGGGVCRGDIWPLTIPMSVIFCDFAELYLC